MNQISPYATGAATFTATQLEPLVSWAIGGFHQPIPSAVPGVISALVIMGVHALGNWLNSRNHPKP